MGPDVMSFAGLSMRRRKAGMLEGPPGRMWRSFPHRKAMLAAGDFPDLGFLVEVRMLRRLMVTHSSVGDIGAVNALTKLEELDV